ncbi:hypothetical protein [Nonomuraea sp. C10]|uniref:hypothetical protein n=1 Tax=Nonomuraea sp. C10 TaxID=2600577 RepID=UPI0011CD4791|nr:hypothetical protein [Nonomuraea sp. C10]TXK41045.1 hypothetical protein FR742_17025 [Nonomuraea sp. C10]
MVIFNELMTRIAGAEPCRAASAYVRGLLADIDRKNCWNLAEHAGLLGRPGRDRHGAGRVGTPGRASTRTSRRGIDGC